MNRFEDLKVFQAALELRVEIHHLTARFPRHEWFGMVSQLRRAAGSVTRHIAEGQRRLTFGEWRQMLSQGRGSLFEVESELIAAHKLGYVDEETLHTIRASVNEVGRMLTGLIRYVRRRELQERTNRTSKLARNSQPVTRN